MTTPDPKSIVAEVSTTWVRGPQNNEQRVPLSKKFEEVIGFNEERGYYLDSWEFHQSAITKDEVLETIIAVFVREPEEY